MDPAIWSNLPRDILDNVFRKLHEENMRNVFCELKSLDYLWDKLKNEKYVTESIILYRLLNSNIINILDDKEDYWNKMNTDERLGFYIYYKNIEKSIHSRNMSWRLM